MPTYEYLCTECGLRFERRQATTAAPLAACPSCAGAIRRLPGGGGGILVRSGAAASTVPCRRETTCCGRDQRCDKPPCGGSG
jgi:putative FmdB family regulatory protein